MTDLDDTSRCPKWRAIPGFEGYYEVSDTGLVRSLDRRIERVDGICRMHYGQLLTPNPDEKGYQYVGLWRDNSTVTRPVHQLVLEAFVGPRPPGTETLHGNGVPADNRLGNLRWGTPSENTQDRVRHGTHNMLTRATCRRGHRLVTPNLVAAALPRRNCLACNQAHAAIPAGRPNRDQLVREYADRRYQHLMAGGDADTRRRPIDVERAAALYVEGLSTRAIGDIFGCDAETIARRLRAAGVTLRRRASAR